MRENANTLKFWLEQGGQATACKPSLGSFSPGQSRARSPTCRPWLLRPSKAVPSSQDRAHGLQRLKYILPGHVGAADAQSTGPVKTLSDQRETDTISH